MKTKFIALVIIAISVAMMIFTVSCDNGNEDVEPVLNEQTEKTAWKLIQIHILMNSKVQVIQKVPTI